MDKNKFATRYKVHIMIINLMEGHRHLVIKSNFETLDPF